MPITPEKVRELAARKEGTTLDFKRDDYDWSTKASNLELAKDLMAMANSLRASSEPGYILIGVDDDGSIVGVATPHTDDANLHQKVKHHLNRVVDFVYSPIEVDGVSVGVYEIRPGGRPFFPLRDAPPLRRHCAMYRDGTSTDIASPTQIIEWSREDDPQEHRHKQLQLRELEARAAVHPVLSSRSVSQDSDGFTVSLHLKNNGQSAFSFCECRYSVIWNSAFRSALDDAIAKRRRHGDKPEYWAWLEGGTPESYEPPSGVQAIPKGGRVLPGEVVEFKFRYTRGEALDHIQKFAIPVDGFDANWAAFALEIPCEGDLGNSASATLTLGRAS